MVDEHTIPSTNEWYGDINVDEFEHLDGDVTFQREWLHSGNVDSFLIDGGERADLGRLLLNDVDGVTVVKNDDTPSRQIADDTSTEETDVSENEVSLDGFFDSSVEFIAGSDVCIEDGSGGEVVLMGGETKKLYDVLDDRFGEDRPVDELFEDDESDSTCVCGNPSCETPIIPEDESDEITECLCGHDPHWEDHGLCPFDEGEDDGCDWCGGYKNPDYSDDEGLCICEHSSCDDGIVCAMDVDDDSRDFDDYFNKIVNLNTTVDVDGASTQQRDMYRDMARMVEQNFETFVDKNKSYGNSFLNTEVGLTDGGPFDSRMESNANGLLVRMSDKMTRLENLLLTDSEDHVGEKSVETALDLANYSLMMAYLVQERGDN